MPGCLSTKCRPLCTTPRPQRLDGTIEDGAGRGRSRRSHLHDGARPRCRRLVALLYAAMLRASRRKWPATGRSDVLPRRDLPRRDLQPLVRCSYRDARTRFCEAAFDVKPLSIPFDSPARSPTPVLDASRGSSPFCPRSPWRSSFAGAWWVSVSGGAIYTCGSRSEAKRVLALTRFFVLERSIGLSLAPEVDHPDQAACAAGSGSIAAR
jgi:hypothetical protein